MFDVSKLYVVGPNKINEDQEDDDEEDPDLADSFLAFYLSVRLHLGRRGTCQDLLNFVAGSRANFYVTLRYAQTLDLRLVSKGLWLWCIQILGQQILQVYTFR